MKTDLRWTELFSAVMILIHFVCATSRNHFSSSFWQVFDDYFTMGEGNCFFVEIPNIVHKQYNIENVRHAQNNNRTSLKLFQKREYLKKHVQFTKKLRWVILAIMAFLKFLQNNINVKGILDFFWKLALLQICHVA